MFLKFTGPLLKITLLQTDWSEAERLTVRNRDFAMMWVATIHPEVLMCVCGLDMQVSAYQAIAQVDFCIVEGHFISRPQSCAFNGGVVTVEIFYEDS